MESKAVENEVGLGVLASTVRNRMARRREKTVCLWRVVGVGRAIEHMSARVGEHVAIKVFGVVVDSGLLHHGHALRC